MTTASARPAAAWLLVLFAAAAAGCTATQPTNALDDFLARLPECATPAEALPHELPLPASVDLTLVVGSPLSSATGTAPGLPGEVVEAILAHPDAEVIWHEDEGFEAEAVLAAHGRRYLIRINALCQGRSSVDVTAGMLDG